MFEATFFSQKGIRSPIDAPQDICYGFICFHQIWLFATLLALIAKSYTLARQEDDKVTNSENTFTT